MKSKESFIKSWLFLVYCLTLLMIVIGGLTRLTDSGLSMVEWKILLGVIPPLIEKDWQEAFLLYQSFPEFQQINNDMTLSEFKFIYLMEYSHRLLGRLLGLLVLIPFIYLWIKKTLSFSEWKKYFFLFVLICLQGFAGWFMVKSGLVDVPTVSQYRLVLHLFLALLFLSLTLWFLLEQLSMIKNQGKIAVKKNQLSWWVGGLFFLLGGQILLGGFVAGLDAGHVSHTFPKMFGKWIPSNMFYQTPWIINFFENQITVHFFHRLFALVLVVYGVIFVIKIIFYQESSFLKKWAVYFILLLGMQIILGILTVVLKVPISLASLHQFIAILLWSTLLVILFYQIKESEEQTRF